MTAPGAKPPNSGASSSTIAVAAATINAAAAVGRSERVGSLEPGKQADLIVLSVDDYRHLGYRFGGNLVKHVIKKGRVYTNVD